jgi:CRP/FNR family cyclic AMP-dependent transcriptional regulator
MQVDDLSSVPLFRAVPPGLHQELVRLFHLRQYQRGAVIFAEGEPGEAVYFVRSGRVKVSRMSAEGHEQTLGLFGPGDPFGLVVLLDRAPYPASAVAVEHCAIWVARCQELLAFLMANPGVMSGVLREVGERLRRTQDRAHALSTGSVHQRLSRYLLSLYQEEGNPVVRLPLTRQELGSYLGATRETISRALTDLRRAGALEPAAEGRLLLHPARLADWS